MKKLIVFAMAAMIAGAAMALTASDNSGDAAYTDGSPYATLDGGTGFGAWDTSASTGGGNFVGDSTAASITGLGTAFALWCNGAAGMNSEAARAFDSALSIGDTFAFTLGLNWDNNNGGSKGFSLYSGASEIFNLNMASASITYAAGASNGDWSTAYGTAAFGVSILYKDASTITVSGTTRDGGNFAATDFAVAGAPDSFKFYMNNADAGDERQIYFDDLKCQRLPRFPSRRR